jgi:hypothetical protein
MVLETEIALRLINDQAVSSLVGDRIYAVVKPDNLSRDCITYERIKPNEEEHYNDLDGGAGVVFCHLQVSSWSVGYEQGKDLASKVKASLDHFDGSLDTITVQDLSLVSETDDYEEETEFYRFMQIYQCFYNETIGD